MLAINRWKIFKKMSSMANILKKIYLIKSYEIVTSFKPYSNVIFYAVRQQFQAYNKFYYNSYEGFIYRSKLLK